MQESNRWRAKYRQLLLHDPVKLDDDYDTAGKAICDDRKRLVALPVQKHQVEVWDRVEDHFIVRANLLLLLPS